MSTTVNGYSTVALLFTEKTSREAEFEILAWPPSSQILQPCYIEECVHRFLQSQWLDLNEQLCTHEGVPKL